MPLTPQDFVSKWKRSAGREKQIYQQYLSRSGGNAVYAGRFNFTHEEILEKLLALNLERAK